MTLDSKIGRYLQEMRAQSAGRPVGIPSLSRLIWRFRLDVPRPLLWPFWVRCLSFGAFIDAIAYLYQHMPFWHYPRMGWIGYSAMGLTYGIGMSAVKSVRGRQFKLSRWYDADHAVREVGYFREFGSGFASYPSIHDFVQKLPSANEERIVAYLKSGHVGDVCLEKTNDVIDPKKAIKLRIDSYSDGVWEWRADLAYYVETYHVRLPDEFVKHVEANRWTVPPKLA